jgi:hypothetical protein
MEKADNEGKASYLETDTKENAELYKHFGFEVLKEFMLPEPVAPMWKMVRMPP